MQTASVVLGQISAELSLQTRHHKTGFDFMGSCDQSLNSIKKVLGFCIEGYHDPPKKSVHMLNQRKPTTLICPCCSTDPPTLDPREAEAEAENFDIALNGQKRHDHT